MDKEEPTYDIRDVFPVVVDNIKIVGNVSKIISEEQFKYLVDNNKVSEFGNSEDGANFIILQYLFTLEEIKNKIEKICGGE